MSTYEHYTTPVPPGTWDIPAAGAARFSWEYDGGRSRLLDLYQRGKDKQWDATKRIDWSIPVNPSDVMEAGEELCPIYGSPQWNKLLAYVMQDEARHVAFGRLALRDYYAELTAAERADREEFVVEGCYLMRNRFTAREVWERMGFDVDECVAFTEQSPMQQAFRTLLFSRIVPCVRDIGLWGPKVQHAYADLGVIEAADSDLEVLMRADEELAEKIDNEKYAAELAARQGEVTDAIAMASDPG